MKVRLTIESLTVLPEPNQSGAIFGPTLGVARNMQTSIYEPPDVPSPETQGGGDLNGSANTANLLGHAGTAAQRIAVPRSNLGNYTGII